MIHDRLPFFDLADRAFLHYSVNAALIHRALRRQQVTRVVARIVERLDLRFEGLTSLVFGNQRELPFGVLRDGYDDRAEHQWAGEAVQLLVLPGDVDRGIAPIQVPQFDGRYDVKFGRDRS